MVQHVVAHAAQDGAADLAHPARAHHDGRSLFVFSILTDELSRLLEVHAEFGTYLQKKWISVIYNSCCLGHTLNYDFDADEDITFVLPEMFLSY